MPDPIQPVTLKTIRQMKAQGTPFACLTCYDATMASILDRAGVHVLLVGDTAAELVLGFRRTIDMPLDVLICLTAAVRRGSRSCMVMADMPFMSYQVNDDEAVRNAGRFMTEGMADCVKLEVDQGHAALVSRMTRAGVPVVAHIGSKPQQAAIRGGYSSAARTPGEIRGLVEDAKALENAGAVLLLLEAVPDEATSAVLEATRLPVIGIGAGTQCHGQVLVIHDLLGISETPPRFAAPVASLGRVIEDAGREWVKRVGAREIGGTRYTMRQGS